MCTANLILSSLLAPLLALAHNIQPPASGAPADPLPLGFLPHCVEACWDCYPKCLTLLQLKAAQAKIIKFSFKVWNLNKMPERWDGKLVEPKNVSGVAFRWFQTPVAALVLFTSTSGPSASLHVSELPQSLSKTILFCLFL